MAYPIKTKISPQIDLIMLNLTVLEIYAKKLLSDPCSIFSNSCHVFQRIKIPTSVLCRIPKETFIPSLVLIGQVESEEKSFQKIVNNQVMEIANMAYGQAS